MPTPSKTNPTDPDDRYGAGESREGKKTGDFRSDATRTAQARTESPKKPATE